MLGWCTSTLALLVVIHVAVAHICIINPPQRGPLNVSDPGDNSCYRRTDFCGGIPIGPITATYYPGQEIEILFQQNLNHWYPQKAGWFDFAISYNTILNPLNATWIYLGYSIPDFPAHDMVWQTNFTFKANLPHQECESCVLRARYVSNNPDEIDPANNTDAIFYNCADIKISTKARQPKFAPHAPKAPPKRPLATSPPSPSCCTPSEWQGIATDGSTKLAIYYSATQLSVRIDRMYDDGTTLSTISNYTDPTNVPEYVNFVTEDECMTYGGDAFYPWCMGEPANKLVFRNDSMMVWSNEDFGGSMLWVTDNDCLPIAWGMKDAMPWEFHVNATSVSANAFTPPADCAAAEGKGCGPRTA